MSAAEPQPLDVLLDVVFEQGLLFLALRNLGGEPALKVSCAFDRPVRGLGGTREVSALRLFRNVELLAPGREIRTLLDTSAAYFARREPSRLRVTVSWRTPAGQRREARIVHDLSIYRDLAYTTEGAAADA
jgi:hypothetical protein